jgi:hypothetical protein
MAHVAPAWVADNDERVSLAPADSPAFEQLARAFRGWNRRACGQGPTPPDPLAGGLIPIGFYRWL